MLCRLQPCFFPHQCRSEQQLRCVRPARRIRSVATGGGGHSYQTRIRGGGPRAYALDHQWFGRRQSSTAVLLICISITCHIQSSNPCRKFSESLTGGFATPCSRSSARSSSSSFLSSLLVCYLKSPFFCFEIV